MLRATLPAEQRRHPRAQLQLPVRLRWLGPFGSQLEFCQSVDASRSGLLIYRPEASQDHSRVWVTFPYDSAANEPQPETPARVVRNEAIPSGGQLVALELELPERRPVHLLGRERRTSARAPLAIPISVRTIGAPWPEEAMTLDVSNAGVRFETSRLYEEGDQVRIRLDFGDWGRNGDVTAHVVRVEPVPGAPELRVAVAWHRPPKGPPGRLKPHLDTDKHR